MGVLLQAFYQRHNNGVPSPGTGDDGDWWWDHLAKQAQSLAKAGFSAIWLPPVNKGANGVKSIGYDVFDDYDIGSKNQKGSIPTLYGNREQLTRSIAILRANGFNVYVDLVENQRAGGGGPGGFTFRYADAEGNPAGGRFPKDPDDFHPNVPEDPGTVPGQDFSFGSDLAPINGKPPGYVFNGLIDAADWLTRSLDIQGYRLDDTKGVSTNFMTSLVSSKSMQGKFAVGEFFDGNLGLIQNWLFAGMQGSVSAFDFPTRFTLARMCNPMTPFNMSELDHCGLAGSNPFNAVTFVENHDTDSTPSMAIISNKALAYAYILTSEGYPCVFYKDYSTDPGCYGLKQVIDPLILIHEKIASGAMLPRFKDFDLFVYERLGGPHLLTALNYEAQNTRTVTVETGFGAHVNLHDYVGHAPDIQTDANGRATLTVPKNLNGLGYVCYSLPGIIPEFEITRQSVTQLLSGSPDLDILPADNTQFIDAGRIWCEKNSPISISMQFDIKDWTADTNISIRVLSGTGAGTPIATKTCNRLTPQGDVLSLTAAITGWHTIQVRADNTPLTNPKPAYDLETTYQAPQVFN